MARFTRHYEGLEVTGWPLRTLCPVQRTVMADGVFDGGTRGVGQYRVRARHGERLSRAAGAA